MLITLVFAGNLRGQQVPQGADSAQDLLLEFRFGALRAPITALGRGDTIYLPLGAIFQQLEIEYDFDLAGPTVRGFFLPDSGDYEIDLARGTAHIGKRSLQIAPGSAIVRPPEVYLRTSALRTVFGLTFELDLRELTLSLSTDKPIPVLVNARRRTLDRPSGTKDLIREQAPLRFPWTRAVFGPGLLQYSLTATRSNGEATLSGDFGAGVDALGGNLEITTQGFSTVAPSSERVFARWLFGLSDDGLRPSRMELGHTFSNGLVPLELNGVRLSNEPWQPRHVLGTYRLHGRTAPGWDAELYVDGAFLEVEHADSLGRVTFQIPLRYGSSFVRIRYLGPAGQESEESIRLQIPFTLLPARTVEYSFAAGQRTELGTPALQATAALGLASWLTGRVGLDRIEDSERHVHQAGYGTATVRLPAKNLLTATAAPTKMNALDLTAIATSGASYDIGYSDLTDDSVYNPAGFPHDFRVRGFAPLQLVGASWLARVDADHLWSRERSQTSLEAEAAVNLPGLRPSLLYRETRLGAHNLTSSDRSVTLGALLYAGGLSRRLHIPSATLIQSQLVMDAPTLRTERWTVTASTRTATYGQVRVGLSGDRSARPRLEVGFLYQGTHFRSSSTGLLGGTGGVTQSVAGSVSYDPEGRSLLWSGRDGLGQGTVRIRPFVDDNGNGRWDAGEPLLRAGYIRVRQALPSLQEDSGRVTRIEALAAYMRYTATVDPGEVENPLWAPAFDSFSFIAEPDRVRTLDVPFYPTGTVDGKVEALGPAGRTSVPGLRMRIRRNDGDVETGAATFSDGGYYVGGLAPGDYVIAPDAGQLRLLRVTATPASIAFRVLASGEGTSLRELNFVLSGPAPTSADKPVSKP